MTLTTSYLFTVDFLLEEKIDCIRPGAFGGFGVWTVYLEYAEGNDISTLPGNLVAATNARMRLSNPSVFQLRTSRLKVKLYTRNTSSFSL